MKGLTKVKNKTVGKKFAQQYLIVLAVGVALAVVATFFVYPLSSLDDPDAVTAAYPQCGGTTLIQRLPVYGGELWVLERKDTGERVAIALKESLVGGRYLLQDGPVVMGVSLSVSFEQYRLTEENGEYAVQETDTPFYLLVTYRWGGLFVILLWWTMIVNPIVWSIRNRKKERAASE